MGERIGPRQADGNPAVPEVVVPHCPSAGYQVFGQQRPKRGLMLLHQMDFIQIFTFVVFSVFSNAPLTQGPTFLKYSIQTGLENNDCLLNLTPFFLSKPQLPKSCIVHTLSALFV